MKLSRLLFFLFLSLSLSVSCKKYLEEIPNKKLAVPTTLREFQQLLDNDLFIDRNTPNLGNFACDDVYFNYTAWQATIPDVRNSYTWADDIYEGQTEPDWNNPYSQVYYSNVVLEGIKNISADSQNQAEYNRIKGTALFYRAFAFYNLEEIFGQPFNKSNSNSQPGIPLKLSSELQEHSSRATVQQTFDQILSDLFLAKDLVPGSIDLANRNRPCKAAVFGLLARIYLTLQEFGNAGKYADSCLRLYSTLNNYNNYSTTASLPFSPQIDEVIIQASAVHKNIVRPPVDTMLYNSYDINDLRKILFFRDNAGIKEFKGTYTATPYLFSGIATDEIYFIRAEAFARNGNITAAMNDLNTVLQKRWKAGVPFINFTATDPENALRLILKERRKELVFRGLRWSDLRRLNQDPQLAISITRKLNGNNYLLEPQGLRYTFPIPDDEIRLSGIMQNPR
jgi:starch-binding outer membrane protein, SusD/RagB family